MTREKRTKPCSNCKRSKVKCIYSSDLPCERCIKIGQGVSCQFIPKLPSLKLPLMGASDMVLPPLRYPERTTSPVLSQVNPVRPILQPVLQSAHQPQNQPHQAVLQPHQAVLQPIQSLQPVLPLQPMNSAIPQRPSISLPSMQTTSDDQWKNSVENRMNSFGNKLNDLVDLLKLNQQFLHSQLAPQVVQAPQSQIQSAEAHIQPIVQSQTIKPALAQPLIEDPPQQIIIDLPPTKKIKLDVNSQTIYPTDFRNGFLTKEQASDLLIFFDANIAQQLFGFEISKFSIHLIWDLCPILVCAICTIALIHHPELSAKSQQLKEYLNDLCLSLLFKGKPTNEVEGFNTIVALVLCSFWLSDSQMFTGLALQLAKEYGLNNPYTENKDKLKLWYLLYILDGQQSLTLNRQPLFNSQEYALQKSREILMPKQIQPKELEEQEEVSLNADMRLVSQVEYNQALNEAFKGNAWELLAPSSFGIPSKSNLDLDKWMVSWTVLLAPGNNSAVWSSKSTLIYYNFAKMHINSSAVRQLQINPNEQSFPRLIQNEPAPKISPKLENDKARLTEVDSEDDSDDSDDDNPEEFMSNKGFVSEDDTLVSANIAVNAATTVLNLVINDKDILDNLKYIPVHIHIMLYYAALLILNPPLKPLNRSFEVDNIAHYNKIITNLRTIKTFQSKIYNNFPIDTKFGDKLIRSLEEIVDDKIGKVRELVRELPANEERNELSRLLADLVESGFSEIRPASPERISAWPGRDHGHP